MNVNPAMSPFSYDLASSDFEQKVIAASHQALVLVDFWAEWCQPCRILKPLLEKLAAEYQGRFILAKINSDENQALATQLGVRGIPSVKAFLGGKLVDEFTGALPENQVRSFIERWLPSPAEPLRLAAREARAKGDLEIARSLLVDALELDPANDTVQLDQAELALDSGDLEAARQILSTQQHRAKDQPRVQSLQARLNLAAAGGGVDLSVLQTRIADNADDFDARLQLAQALALQQDYRPALEHLLRLVQQDRHWQDQAARKAMLDLFTLLGQDPAHNSLVREFRIALARTLN